MVSKLDIPLHGPSVNIVRQCQSELGDVLLSKFGCDATITGVNRGEKRFEVKLDSGFLVSVWKADLSTFSVDAVVNAANEHLKHVGGLALALSKAGGPQIQKESDDFIKKYNVLKTGNAVIMDAWALPCKKIIHAVGPQLLNSHDVPLAKPLLIKTIHSILDLVMKNNLQTVAIPAISSGIFNYPLPQCADTIVTTVKQYCESYSAHACLKEILLVNNDERTVKEMERACRDILLQRLPMKGAASKSKGGKKPTTPTIQVGKVHLTLKWGQVEDEKTDVIVNSTSKRSWCSGQISNAILRKAGSEMERDLNTATVHGNGIVTDSYRLHCKKVYHIVFADSAITNQTLCQSVMECLVYAATNYKSIAFPAIGTGGLGFKKDEVAQIMLHAVVSFAQKASQKMEIYFVIYPSDTETFKAFERQMGNIQQNAPFPSLTHVYEHQDDVHGSRASSPQISLRSPSDEATREAERWLTGLLFETFGTVFIYNNFIMHFGEHEHHRLSRIMKRGISIQETFESGRASIIIEGDSSEDVIIAALQVEAMLCHIHREFISDKKDEMALMSTKTVSFQRIPVDLTRPELSGIISAFKKENLRIVKVDKVENNSLKVLFDLKKSQLSCLTSRKMCQCIQAQFFDMISHIGFHSECAPPREPAYGEGIYFAGSVKKAMEVWGKRHQEYLHFVEAEVLTGTSTPGKPGLILPPAIGPEPFILYDSLSGGPDISVIFSGYQALPRYIITCKTLWV